MLITGQPVCKVDMLTWDKVRGRLSGDESDNIPYFYTGFAARARRRQPGDSAVFV